MGLRNWASTKWTNTTAWIKRNPTLSGAIAGGIAGTSLFPGLGTVGGIVTGAALGNQVGKDPSPPEPKKDEGPHVDPWSEGQEAVTGANYPKGLRFMSMYPEPSPQWFNGFLILCAVVSLLSGLFWLMGE